MKQLTAIDENPRSQYHIDNVGRVTVENFKTHAKLERQMDVARQLRAETLHGTAWISRVVIAMLQSVLRLWRQVAASTPRRA